MSIYFIDFENLRNEALNGIEQLTAEDRVFLFYSNHADSISFEVHQALMSCAASITYFKIKRGGKNSLDFQLTCQLSYLMGIVQNQALFIVSRDNGFTFVQDFWSQHPTGENTVKRCTSILATLSPSSAATNSEEETTTSPASEQDESLNDEDATTETETNENVTAGSSTEEMQVKPHRLQKRGGRAPKQTAKQERTNAQAPKKPSLQKMLSGMLKELCDNTTMQKIAKLLVDSQSKQEFYRSIISLMGQKQGLEIYRIIGSEYYNLKDECECL